MDQRGGDSSAAAGRGGPHYADVSLIGAGRPNIGDQEADRPVALPGQKDAASIERVEVSPVGIVPSGVAEGRTFQVGDCAEIIVGAGRRDPEGAKGGRLARLRLPSQRHRPEDHEQPSPRVPHSASHQLPPCFPGTHPWLWEESATAFWFLPLPLALMVGRPPLPVIAHSR